MKLNENNFLLYAMNNYQNASCVSMEEFENDIKVFTYIKKLLSRQDSNHRLILNHIIVLFNVFGDSALNMIFYKIDENHWNDIVTHLVYINRMPDEVKMFNIKMSDFSLNQDIINSLRNI